ncbi:MAG: Crp/Fnr family transcriptional regulator [Pseudomonadota bacterium]
MLPRPEQRPSPIRSPEAEAISSTQPFHDISGEAVAALAEAASVKSYAAGATVFAMGQYDGSEFLIVRSGRLKVSHADAKTGAMLFENVQAGEMFGLAIAAAGGDAARLAGVSLSAERDSEIVAVDAEVLRDLAGTRPSLARNLMLYFARQLSGEARPAAEESSPERRVYAALAAYVERDAVNADWRIPRMPKHRELADRADVEETHAASAVAKLIQSGVARRNYPGLIIDDIAQLNRLAR